MRNYDLSPLLRRWIGFDKLASSMQGSQEAVEFPPYNIEKKTITTIVSRWPWPGFSKANSRSKWKGHA